MPQKNLGSYRRGYEHSSVSARSTRKRVGTAGSSRDQGSNNDSKGDIRRGDPSPRSTLGRFYSTHLVRTTLSASCRARSSHVYDNGFIVPASWNWLRGYGLEPRPHNYAAIRATSQP